MIRDLFTRRDALRIWATRQQCTTTVLDPLRNVGLARCGEQAVEVEEAIIEQTG